MFVGGYASLPVSVRKFLHFCSAIRVLWRPNSDKKIATYAEIRTSTAVTVCLWTCVMHSYNSRTRLVFIHHHRYFTFLSLFRSILPLSMPLVCFFLLCSSSTLFFYALSAILSLLIICPRYKLVSVLSLHAGSFLCCRRNFKIIFLLATGITSHLKKKVKQNKIK